VYHVAEVPALAQVQLLRGAVVAERPEHVVEQLPVIQQLGDDFLAGGLVRLVVVQACLRRVTAVGMRRGGAGRSGATSPGGGHPPQPGRGQLDALRAGEGDGLVEFLLGYRGELLPACRLVLREVKVRVGSQQAVGDLLADYGDLVLRVVRRRLPQTLRRLFDSHDFAQVVWGSIFRHRSRLNRFNTADEFVAFVATVAANKVRMEALHALSGARHLA
jgi:hypothetical protein